MIEPLDPASSPEVSKQASALGGLAAGKPVGKTTGKPNVRSFASLLEPAVARGKSAGFAAEKATTPKSAANTGGVAPPVEGHKSAAGAKSPNPRNARIPVPEGETWKATKPGAHYAQIVSGPRKGLYINLTHGSRRGETFTIEQRGGKTLHVYNVSGKEVEVKPSTDANAVTDAAKRSKDRHRDLPPKGERWAPVEGHHNYADILGGKRNGLYVNTSGGMRDGMAFQIVKKGGKWWHVYGTGKHRQWIPSDGPNHKPHRSDEPKGTKGTNAATGTGGTPATSGTGGSKGTNGTTGGTAAGSTGGVAPPSAA